MTRRFGREEPENTSGPPADPVAVAREIALRQLAGRARTRAELEKALAARGVPSEASSEVLERFEELRLIDDAGFARAWAEGQQRRLKSTRVLAQELRTKGVDPETVAEALDELEPDADYRAALALARKKAPAMAGLDRRVRYRRLAGALARRGFASGVVHRVLSEVTGDEGDVDGGDDAGSGARW